MQKLYDKGKDRIDKELDIVHIVKNIKMSMGI